MDFVAISKMIDSVLSNYLKGSIGVQVTEYSVVGLKTIFITELNKLRKSTPDLKDIQVE
jgi:hypothetical protein